MQLLLLQPYDTALLFCTQNLLTKHWVPWLDRRELDARVKKGADLRGQRAKAPLGEEALPASLGDWRLVGRLLAPSSKEEEGVGQHEVAALATSC